MRCYKISSKLFSIFKIQIILILLLSTYSLSGCINNSYEKIDEYEFISISEYDVNKSLNQAKKWMILNLNNDGFSNYLYDYKNDLILNENNFIHQLKVSRLIAELSNYNNSINETHMTNIEYILNNYYIENNNLSYIVYQNNSDIIFDALFLRSLLASPMINNYSDYIYKIANTIINFQNENGSFISDITLKDNDNPRLNFDFNEEIILSLFEMYNFTNENKYLEHAILSQDYFIEKYLIKLNEKDYLGLIPGNTKSIKKLYEVTNDEKYSSILIFLNNKLIDFQETENLTNIGHFLNIELNRSSLSDSSLDGYIIEGFADIYQLFENISNDDINTYKIRILIGIYNLINMQYGQSYGKINGAIKFNYNNHLIRIDSTQNAIETFHKILSIFNEEDNWNYSYYPELNLLLSNNQDINIEDNVVWYALIIGTIFSIIFVFILYIFIKIKSKLK